MIRYHRVADNLTTSDIIELHKVAMVAWYASHDMSDVAPHDMDIGTVIGIDTAPHRVKGTVLNNDLFAPQEINRDLGIVDEMAVGKRHTGTVPQ